MPLFALRGADGWGIGEMGDLGAFCRWLASAGHHFLQLLPINEISAAERSPYAALSAFALDPIYLSLDAVEDFAAAGGEAALPPPERTALETLRSHPGIDYGAVRATKERALELAFGHFLRTEWRTDSRRAQDLRRFTDDARGWLASYALFRSCHAAYGARSWRAWDPGLRERRPDRLAAARSAFEPACRFHAYVQWLAATQWAAARREAGAAGVRIAGDLPFMVGEDSADVWERQSQFSLDATLGAPPDAFNAAGQEWGLPVCRWDEMAGSGFDWLRARVGRAAELFDTLRLDHVVGFFRMYVIPPHGAGSFVPGDGAEQLARGEQLLGVVREAAGATALIGEDLGVVPDFVRAVLTRMALPGYRVLRWEADGPVFRDPTTYPLRSVATTGTHDTSALATWWSEELDDEGRRALAAVPSFGGLAGVTSREYTPGVQAALLGGLYAAAAELVVLPFPDVYGGRERINVPATVGPGNWSYRLPWTQAELAGAAGQELRDRLFALAAGRARARD